MKAIELTVLAELRKYRFIKWRASAIELSQYELSGEWIGPATLTIPRQG